MYKFFLPGTEDGYIEEPLQTSSDKSAEADSKERIYRKILQQSKYVPPSDWILLGLVFKGVVTYTDLKSGKINYRDVLYLNDALTTRSNIEALEIATAQAEAALQGQTQ